MPADFVAYYIKKFLRQPNASLAREYLGIGTGGGDFVLSNSNNVSFGSNGSIVTATATFAGGGGAAISAGASSQSTGTVIFSNLNGLTFALNAGTLTASHDGLTSQSNQAASASNGSFTFQTLGFSNANNVTFGTSAGSIITASVGTAAPSPVNFSAGTTSNDLGSVVFSDSNGISFGLNGSTITASHNGLTSQSNQAFSASGGSSAFQTLVFNPANGATFSNNAGSVELSYTVPSTAGLISAINISACTTSNNLTAVTFSNANGITFGLDASTITASHNGLTSQSNQAASASNGSFAFQTIAFSDANNVTFGTSAGSIITASVNAAGGGVTANIYSPPWAYSSMATLSSLDNRSLYFQPFDLPFNLSASRINFYMNMVGTMGTNNSTGSGNMGLAYALYTHNPTNASSQSISLLTSYSAVILSQTRSSTTQYAATYFIGLSNATSHSTAQTAISAANASTFSGQSISGFRVVALPVNLTMTPGRYWLGVINSTTNVQMTNQMYVAHSAAGLQPNWQQWGLASVASNASVFPRMQGWGFYSATTAAFPNIIALSTDQIRKNVSGTLVHFDLIGYGTSTNFI